MVTQTSNTLTALLKYYKITNSYKDMKIITQNEEVLIICIYNFNQKKGTQLSYNSESYFSE